jgi:hypothetical protein
MKNKPKVDRKCKNCSLLAYPETVVVPELGPLNELKIKSLINKYRKNNLCNPYNVLSQSVVVPWVVGAAEVAAVGNAEGDTVGAGADGVVVDWVVGAAEGVAVGNSEGVLVGKAEGDTVGTAVYVLTKIWIEVP